MSFMLVDMSFAAVQSTAVVDGTVIVIVVVAVNATGFGSPYNYCWYT